MIRFYQITAGYNVIGKSRRRAIVTTLQVKLKQDMDVINPIILIYSEDPLDHVNYCQIYEFNRYYYINHIEQVRKNLYRFKCRVDVLESYKLDILNSKDVEFHNAVDVVQTIKHSEDTTERETSYILTTIGG